MKTTSLVVLCAFLMLPVQAQSHDRVGSWNCDDLAETGIDYPKRVNEALFPADRSSGAWIRVIVLPAFEPEWAVTVYRDDRVCEARVADRQVWSANLVEVDRLNGDRMTVWSEEPVSVPVTVRRTTLSRSTVAILEATWRSALRQPPAAQVMVYDATLYRFLVFPPHECSEAWSPSAHTIAGRLAGLAGRLRDLASSGSSEEQKRAEDSLRQETIELARLLDGSIAR